MPNRTLRQRLADAEREISRLEQLVAGHRSQACVAEIEVLRLNQEIKKLRAQVRDQVNAKSDALEAALRVPIYTDDV